MPINNDTKSNNEKKEEKKEEPTIKVWNDSEVQLLKKWGETASSYRLLHDRAYRYYNKSSYMFAVPIIVFSTITGTASFSQTLFPEPYQPYVPMVIGGVNIFIGILGTLARFFRVDELTESHRVASVSYGKFARNISTELSLPPINRRYNGADLVEMCRSEMDRLIEQSPVIPMHILLEFKNNEEFAHISKPEVLDIKPIEEYKLSKEEKVSIILTDVVEKLRQNKPEKTYVQQMAEKHLSNQIPIRAIPPSIKTNTSIPIYNNLSNNAPNNMSNNVPNNVSNNVQNNISNNIPNNNMLNNIPNNNILNSETSNISNNILNNVNENVIKIASEQKDKINEELNNMLQNNVVSNAKAKFQGLIKKAVSKEELKNVTTNVINNAIENGENGIADVEMGIIKTKEELDNNK